MVHRSTNISEAQKTYIKALLKTKRQCVSQSYDFVETTFVHEMGHMLDDVVFKLQNTKGQKFIIESMKNYSGGVSGYATSTTSEYVAESYVAYRYGETDILDPELIKIFKGAEK